MKILITGGAGFIGSNTIKKLLPKGYEVVVLDNLNEQIHGNQPEVDSATYANIKDKVHFIKGDVINKSDWKKALKGVEAVVHLAAETGTGQSMYQINHYCNVNTIGTAQFLDILANENHTVKKVIIASSRAIYGEGKYFSEELGFVYPETRREEHLAKGIFEPVYKGCKKLTLVATDEDSKIHPTSVYGINKQNQEQLILTVCGSLGIDAISLRYQNVYGPGQSLVNPYTGILSIFSTLILQDKSINIFEDGLESRDFVYIEDVVDATILALESNAHKHNIFNVGAGIATDVLTVAKTLAEKYGKKTPIQVNGNYRIGDIRHNYADISRITRELGFIPKVNFATGATAFANWVSTQQLQESAYDKSIEEMKSKGLYK
jgi:dTDP-L-rhamnose 4-epimerase